MKNPEIKRMATLSLLVAMIIVLQFIGSLIPPIGGMFSISLVLIPIVIGGALYGPSGGAILGAAFGIMVAINCATGADPGGQMVFQSSAVMCIFVVITKGILAGLATGYIYKVVSKFNAYIAMFCAAIICPVINTGVFLICMNVFFKDVLTAWANGNDIIVYMFSGIILCNFVPELIINVIFSPAGQRILQIARK